MDWTRLMDRYGLTVLHIAAQDNKPDEIPRLLSLGFNVDILDNSAHTPLHEATSKNRGESHYETIKVLLRSGADVNARNGRDLTPIAFLHGRTTAKVYELLLNFNAEVEGEAERTLLFGAVLNGKIEVVKLLLDRGCDVNCADTDGYSLLHAASSDGKIAMLKFLLKNGADTGAVSVRGCTPFMSRLKHYNPSEKKVAYLLKYSDINVQDSEGRNVLDFAKREFDKKIILEHIAKLQALNIFVHPDLTRKISTSPEDTEYLKRCSDELTMAKSMKLRSSWVTFFHLLVGSNKKLKNYAGNKELIRDYKKSNCKSKFPIYGVTIWKNVNKGIKIRRAYDKSSVVLSGCLPIFDHNHLVLRDVLDSLEYKDYLKFLCRQRKRQLSEFN